MESFINRSNQVYILTKKLISFLNDNGFKVNAFYINVFPKCPKVVVAVDNDLLINDAFVELSYPKIFELKKIFENLFESRLDLGLVGSDLLEEDLLQEDGFGYKEKFSS